MASRRHAEPRPQDVEFTSRSRWLDVGVNIAAIWGLVLSATAPGPAWHFVSLIPLGSVLLARFAIEPSTDTLLSRWLATRRIRKLERRVAAWTTSEGESARIVLVGLAEFGRRYEKCVSLRVLGAAGGDEGEPTRVAVIGRSLLSSDPFVRQAAAEALRELSDDGAKLRPELELVRQLYPHEEAAEIASDLLGDSESIEDSGGRLSSLSGQTSRPESEGAAPQARVSETESASQGPRASASGNTQHGADPPEEPDADLLQLVKQGDTDAAGALFRRYELRLRRWAHGRLPANARGELDTQDLVQETLVHVFQRINECEPIHAGAFRDYVWTTMWNRVRDIARAYERRGSTVELGNDLAASSPSPLEEAMGAETLARYEAALERLRPEDREAVIARVELRLSHAEVAQALGKPSAAAAHMAVSRALVRLSDELGQERNARGGRSVAKKHSDSSRRRASYEQVSRQEAEVFQNAATDEDVEIVIHAFEEVSLERVN